MNANNHYTNLITNILEVGKEVTTRNGKCLRRTGISRVFSPDDSALVTIRKTAWKSALREMEWFLSGSCDINDLHPSVHKWWAPWADKNGIIRNNYSTQFTDFAGQGNERINQIDYIIKSLKYHPNSRRAVISTWNTADMANDSTPITNCHGTTMQFFVDPETNALDMIMYQRSADVILGLQHNWIQYKALLIWLAAKTGREVGTFTWIGGDCHIYQEHVPAAVEILLHPKTDVASPGLTYTCTNPKGAFKADDFALSMFDQKQLKRGYSKPIKMVV